MSTLVIIPAYNEEACIAQTVQELQEQVPDYDYIIVNDGSRDSTAHICRSLGFNLIDLPVNLGLSRAFQTGMKYAFKHDYGHAIQFDADGQHIPEYISDLVETMDSTHADIVIGSRFVSERKPASLRMLGFVLIAALIRLTTGETIKDPTPGMRFYNKPIIEQFAVKGNLTPEPEALAFSLFWLFLSGCLLAVALFPNIAYFFSKLLDIQSPSIFIFLTVITLLMIREFTIQVQLTQLRRKLAALAQEIALRESKTDK